MTRPYTSVDPESGSTVSKAWRNSACFRWCVYLSVPIGLLLLVILLPLSFHGVDYNQYAFKRNTISQNIDWSTVYSNGNWFWGVGYTSFVFPKTLIQVNLVNLSIIPTSGLEFFLNATFFYRLNGTADALHNLFQNFGTTGYNDQVTKLVIGDIKNAAPIFTVDDYLSRRFYVEDELESIIRPTLAQNNIILDEGMFFLLSMQFPDRVLGKYLQTGVQAQQTTTAMYEQNQTLIEQETQYMINMYTNNASYVSQTTAAEVNNKITIANATGYNLVQEAEGSGLQYFLNQIPLTNPADIEIVVRTMAFIRNKPQFFIGNFDSVLIGKQTGM